MNEWKLKVYKNKKLKLNKTGHVWVDLCKILNKMTLEILKSWWLIAIEKIILVKQHFISSL